MTRNRSVTVGFYESAMFLWNKVSTSPEHVSSVNLSCTISKLLDIKSTSEYSFDTKPLIKPRHQRCMASANVHDEIVSQRKRRKSCHYCSSKASQAGLEYTVYISCKNQT